MTTLDQSALPQSSLRIEDEKSLLAFFQEWNHPPWMLLSWLYEISACPYSGWLRTPRRMHGAAGNI
jgi:hypothetical protein